MKSIRAIFARHGEAEGQGKVAKGRRDYPLDAHGKQEAKKLGEDVAKLKPDVVVTSPLQRAKIPAQKIADRAGVPLKVNKGLLPWDFGDWTGKPESEVHPKLRDLWRNHPDKPIPGGESFSQSVQSAKKGILQALGAGKRPAIVTHSRNLRQLPHILSGKPTADPTKGGPEPGQYEILTKEGKLIHGSKNQAQDEADSQRPSNDSHRAARTERK